MGDSSKLTSVVEIACRARPDHVPAQRVGVLGEADGVVAVMFTDDSVNVERVGPHPFVVFVDLERDEISDFMIYPEAVPELLRLGI